MDAGERKRATAAVFGRAAGVYERTGVAYFDVFGRELVERVGVRAGETVLDVGAGRGAATFPAAERGARVIAGDLAPEMVELLAADAAARGLAGIEARVMDAEDPDVPPGGVDVVLCSFVVFLLPDPMAALRRYRAALRPGGRLGVTIFAGYEDRWQAVNDVLDAVTPAAFRSAPGADPGPVGTPQRLADSLGEVGFDDVRVEVVGHDAVFADPDQWWAWAWSHGRRALLERLDPDTLDRVRRDAYAVLAGLAGADGRLTLRQDVCYAVARQTP